MKKQLIILLVSAVLLVGCQKREQITGQASHGEPDPRKAGFSTWFRDTDSVSGYDAFAKYDSIDDKIISPVVVKYSYERVKELVKSGKLPDKAMVYPKIEDNTIVGVGSRYTGEIGDVIFYNHISDSFSKFGKLKYTSSVSDGLFPFKEELEPILYKAVPEEDRRDWIQRWQGGPTANGCEIIEVVNMAPGEIKEFSIPRDVPTWVGFLIEEVSAVSKDPGRIALYPKEHKGSNSGYPTVRAVSRPINGALEFSIVNETEISTHLAIFIDKRREVQPSIR